MEYFEGLTVSGEEPTSGAPVLMKRKPIFNLEIPIGLAELVYCGDVSAEAGWLFGSIWTLCAEGSILSADALDKYLPGRSHKYVRRCMNELIDHGFAKRYRVCKNGRVASWGYLFMDPDHPPAEADSERIDVPTDDGVLTYTIWQNRRSRPEARLGHLEDQNLQNRRSEREEEIYRQAVAIFTDEDGEPQNTRSAPEARNVLLARAHKLNIPLSVLNSLYSEGYISKRELRSLRRIGHGWVYNDTDDEIQHAIEEEEKKKKLKECGLVSAEHPETPPSTPDALGENVGVGAARNEDVQRAPKKKQGASGRDKYDRIQEEVAKGRAYSLRNLDEQEYRALFESIRRSCMFGDRYIEDQMAACRPYVDHLFDPDVDLEDRKDEWGEAIRREIAFATNPQFGCMGAKYPSMFVKDRYVDWRMSARGALKGDVAQC